jgi:mono/diheme cytochrome c family protein
MRKSTTAGETAMRRLALKFALTALLTPFAAAAQTDQSPGDRAAGRAIATRTCSECHLVPGGPAPTARRGGPPFVEIANRPTTTAPGLRSLLRAPHVGMPMFQFTDRELDDLVTYLLSLRRSSG